MATALIVYLCLAVAGFMILLVAFLGGVDHDAGFDHDVGIDHDHDAGHDAGGDGDHTMSPSVFSLKVISCFLMGFGLGSICSHSWWTANLVDAAKYPIDLGCGLVGGVLVGFLGWGIIKLFLSQQGDTRFRLDEFVGKRTQLTLGIATGGIGEISCEINGTLRSLDVRSLDGTPLPTGTPVEVVSLTGNIGLVRRAQ